MIRDFEGLIARIAFSGLMVTSFPFSGHAQSSGQPTAEIIPFKASYSLNFGPAGAKSPFTGGNGRLTVELKGSRCTDYQMTRTVNGTLNSKNGPIKIQSEAKFTENPAATQLAFSFKDQANGNIVRLDSLVATRDDNGIITVTSRGLSGGKTTLPKNTVFPLHHERMMMAVVRGDQKTVSANVYNPEISLTGIDQISYTFGPLVAGALPKGHPADIDELRNEPRRRVETISRDIKTGKVRVREKMTRYNNHILTVSNAVLEHLEIKANLVALTLLPQKPCS